MTGKVEGSVAKGEQIAVSTDSSITRTYRRKIGRIFQAWLIANPDCYNLRVGLMVLLTYCSVQEVTYEPSI